MSTAHEQTGFLSVLAHRLRNPLSPIMMCIPVLQNRAPQDKLMHHALALMDRQLAQLVRVLEDLAGDNSSEGPGTGTPVPASNGANAEADEAGIAQGEYQEGIKSLLVGVQESITDGQPRRPKHRVLVVDDNPDAAEALRLLLGMKGFEVFTASDGAQAIQRTRECAPQVVLMDIGMPNMNGWEAARRIHAIPGYEAIPIVALTGMDRDSDRERSQEAGMITHLVKPVAATTLQDLLRSLIAGSAAPGP